MAERNVIKKRTCSHCHEPQDTDAKGMKTHYTGCARVPSFFPPREPNRHPPKKEVKK